MASTSIGKVIDGVENIAALGNALQRIESAREDFPYSEDLREAQENIEQAIKGMGCKMRGRDRWLLR